MEKKEQFYELQTFTYYVHLSVFQLSCIFFAQSLNKHYFSLFNYEICGFFKKNQKKKTRGASPLCEAPRILTRLWAMKLSNTKFPQYGKIKRKACSNCSVS